MTSDELKPGTTFKAKGFTFNIHWLRNGEVGFGRWKGDDELPADLGRMTVDDFLGAMANADAEVVK